MHDYLNRLFLLTIFLVTLGITVRVCSNDARRRGKSPLLVCAIVLCSFPLGLIAWLLFRPDPIDTARRQQEFRLEDHRVQ